MRHVLFFTRCGPGVREVPLPLRDRVYFEVPRSLESESAKRWWSMDVKASIKVDRRYFRLTYYVCPPDSAEAEDWKRWAVPVSDLLPYDRSLWLPVYVEDGP